VRGGSECEGDHEGIPGEKREGDVREKGKKKGYEEGFLRWQDGRKLACSSLSDRKKIRKGTQKIRKRM